MEYGISDITSIVNLDDSAIFKWRMTDVCNYYCSYCLHFTHEKAQEPEEDKERCWRAIPHVRRICEEMSENTGKKVKIQLIGGEVTVFSWLPDFLKELTVDAPWLKCVNITSNFSRSNDWWRELIKSSHVPITATMSYHPEGYKDGMEDFVNRLAELQGEKIFKYVKAETVYCEEFQHAKEFSELCKEKGVDCLIDSDLRKKGRNTINPHKYTHKEKGSRYRILFSDGTAKELQSRNEFLKTYGEDGKYIDCDGFYCTMFYDHIDCSRDKITACNPIFPYKENSFCSACLVDDFHPLKTIFKCPKGIVGKNSRCTICGNMSLYRDGCIPERLKVEKLEVVKKMESVELS